MLAQAYGQPIDHVVLLVYLAIMVGFGATFARYTRSTRDFFVSGQRFTWWLISVSFIATLVGSYSFMKYAEAGYRYGLSSTMSYTNDWFAAPLWMFGWLPIIYFGRITSVPEYFERRFGKDIRLAGTVLILLYMIGYIGFNFYTLGKALEPLFPIQALQSVEHLNLMVIVVVIAVVCAIYVAAGGQTSVIMTDLLQGFILLIAGFVLFGLGLYHLGGFGEFWSHLPVEHKFGMAEFNTNEKFSHVGVFWQDGMANSIAFYFMNQGVLMRFLSVKSPREARKATIVIILILMPVTAVAVSNAGWLGTAIQSKFPDELPKGFSANQVFVVVSELLCRPGVFGLVLAALVAALMSTVDTLINAVATILINDVYRPYVVKDKEDRHYLRAARWFSIGATLVGVLLVPVFLGFKSMYAAHAAFTAAITPPIVVVILLSITWKRYNRLSALATIVLGTGAMVLSFAVPQVITPFAHGVPMAEAAEFYGKYKYMRACYGMLMCMGIGIVATFLTWNYRAATETVEGLTIWTLLGAKRRFKGGEPKRTTGKKIRLKLVSDDGVAEDVVAVHPDDLSRLSAAAGDLLYLADKRWWLGGLRSLHINAGDSTAGVERGTVRLSSSKIEEGRLRVGEPVVVELIM
ncbi:MAG: sodium/solute symporter [Phycisphaerae bacterium]|nr:sodium/solute symporter [Phycisphaerae bacterium]